MQDEHLFSDLKPEHSLAMRLVAPGRWKIRTVVNSLFRLSCWSAAAWLVWNHALSNFFNSGGIGPLMSFGLGAFLHAVSMILEDGEA